ncbi:universal stress protein [Chitinophagaceae bacterium LB-8]|jgi:nucleotide-binding universal stress UspA family protein|uniref:Universal stress protein n=1 Tax=Paraflavisolibacter caeni TaxID=2982496 RepID=A0A9X2XXK7_9BACT|nr:universal stress protein [Paraflavisolibacter caeni]MCU7550950.1 universal stress protein [Paraflavisolibacter caeni]
MKTLIVPTDFSPAAENAMHYAAHLARQIEAEVLLVHVYQIPVSMNDMPVILVSAEELKKNADESLGRSAQELSNAFPGLNIRTESRLGDVNDELEDMSKDLHPVAIVMGSHGSSGLERLIFGSTTLSVIRDSRYPVIAVPAHYKDFSLQNVVLAADLQEGGNLPVEMITEVMQHLNTSIHIVHVTNKEDPDTELQRDILLNKLQSFSPTYHAVQGENVRDCIIKYLKEEKADLLLVFPHEHNLMERLFFKLHSLDIVKHSTIPVMTIKC